MRQFVVSAFALVCLLAVGVSIGGASSWWIQGLRLDAVKAEKKAVQSNFDGFVESVKQKGEAAKNAADAKEKDDKQKKDASDEDYQSRIAGLAADVDRMRRARTSTNGGFVPKGASSPSRADIACFDRTQLESSIRKFDSGVQGLVDKGSQATIGLDAARRWAKSVKE